MVKTLEGSHAIAEVVVNCEAEVLACYPITPSTHIAEKLQKFYADGKIPEYITVEQEFSAISALAGASAAGARTFTTTSSQGVALMHEVLYATAGMRLPIVMCVANRSLNSPLGIWCDHQDIMPERDSGWIILMCESNQEAVDTLPQAYKIAESLLLPVMVCIDGFYLTHAVEQIDIPQKEIIQKFLPKFKPEFKLDSENPVTLGIYSTPEFLQDFREDIAKDVDNSREPIKKTEEEFSKIIGRKYGNGLIENYKCDDAERVIIAMSSFCGNIKEAIDELREKGEKVGLLRIKSFRPFPYEDVRKIIEGKKHIGVFDRATTLGGYPPLYTDVLASVYDSKLAKKVSISSFIGGIGGKDVTVEDAKNIFKSLKNKKIKREFV
ncbi:MAG: pyruvate ferredoxin oxidoreductase [Candidatus Micrarchaeia archaeon]|jgi:pyruvate ferredoxin oxidoreductase alpha subunit